MEPVIECIMSVIESVGNRLLNANGSDFIKLMSTETEHYETLCGDISRLFESTDENLESYEMLISALEKWNCELRNLIENVHMDVDVQRITKLQSNTIITLSEEERKSLKVKKDKRIKDLKLKINKLIIKFEELIISVQEQLEFVAYRFDYIDNVNDTTDVFEDIEMRYNAAIMAEQQRQHTEDSPSITNHALDNKRLEVDVEEEKRDDDNEKKVTDVLRQNNVKEYRNKEQELGSEMKDSIVLEREERTIEKSSKNVESQPIERETLKPPVYDEFADQLNWTKHRYTISNGEFADMDLGCMISSFKGSLKEREYVMVMIKSIDDLPLRLDATYEILSNVIQIEPAGLEVEFDSECPWKVSIPYLMIRNASKEVVIICHDLTNGRNMNLDTQELIFDDNKEGGFKLAEAFLPSPSCICIVVSKRKIERFYTDKRGNKFVSNIDPRVVLTMAQNSVKIKVNIEMSVLQIESGYLNELISKIAINNLYSMSPIVEIKSDYSRNFLKTASLQIPIPNILAHANRGRAVSARPQTMDKVVKRSKSAITRQISTDEDPVIKVGIYNSQDNVWRTNNNLNFVANKNKDCVEIDIQNLGKQKVVVIRCDENFNDEQLNKSIDIINKGLETRVVQFIIRQHSTDPSRIALVAANPNKMDKIQKYLTQENFTEDSSVLSPEFVIRERSKLTITCKGNLEIENEKVLTHRYNSQLPNRKEFFVKEIDKFAQKSKDLYQGFIVISEVMQTSANRLWESVINIPKTDIGNKKEHRDINAFDFRPTDIINKHYLRFLAQQLGKDWMALGKCLKVSELTIRRISNNSFIDTQTMAYECLLKWIKNATVYSKKMIVMEKALRSIGRFDLVQDLAQRVLIG